MKNIGFKRFFLIMGMIAGYMIGVGFASGQEALQVFTAWNYIWGGSVASFLNVGIGAICFHIYAVAGRESEIPVKSFGEVFLFYGGSKTVGRIMDVFPVAAYYAMYMVMIAGFAALMSQNYGMNIYIGNAIITVICIVFTILGIEKYIDILGGIGPFTVAIVLLTGCIGLAKLGHQIPTNLELLRTGEITALTIGTNPWSAGIILSGFTLLLGLAFMSALGNDYRQYKYKSLLLTNLVGMGLVGLGCAVMGLTHLANLTESLKYAIPNVALLGQLGMPWLGTILSIFIIIEIITSAVPSIWSVSKTFFFEKTRNFNILTIALGIGSFFICNFVPYAILMNYTFTYAGYAGLMIGAIMVYFYVRYCIKNKKWVVTEGVQLEARGEAWQPED